MRTHIAFALSVVLLGVAASVGLIFGEDASKLSTLSWIGTLCAVRPFRPMRVHLLSLTTLFAQSIPMSGFVLAWGVPHFRRSYTALMRSDYPRSKYIVVALITLLFVVPGAFESRVEPLLTFWYPIYLLAVFGIAYESTSSDRCSYGEMLVWFSLFPTLDYRFSSSSSETSMF